VSLLPADPGPVVVVCDGASRGNPGPAGIGAAVYASSGEVLAEIAEGIGETTNNVAEYGAMIAGLARAADLGATDVTVKADSLLMVQQMKGVFKVKADHLKPMHAEARTIARGFKRVAYVHIPREQNTHADRLANQGVDEWLAGDRGAR